MLKQKKSEYSFFKCLVMQVIPLIRLLLPNKVAEWEKLANERRLDRQFYSYYDMCDAIEPWVIWDYFMYAEWSWDDKRDYFKNYKLIYEKTRARLIGQLKKACVAQGLSPQTHSVSNKHFFSAGAFAKYLRSSDNHLWLHELRAEMRIVQSEKRRSKFLVSLFRKDIFSNFINRLFKDALFEENSVPYALKLDIVDTRYILLEVEWSCSLTQVYILKNFQETSRLAGQIKEMFDNKGKFVELVETKDSGESARETLRRAGFWGPLLDLFTAFTRMTAMLKTDRIIISGLNREKNKKQIKKEILKFLEISKEATHKEAFKLEQAKKKGKAHRSFYIKVNKKKSLI
jgi:hypothetical protein